MTRSDKGKLRDKSNYSKQDIVDCFKKLGLKKGDNVFVQSNIGLFGYLKDARRKSDYYRIFKEAFFEVIGDEGTLINPTFTYSFCKGENFDVNNTPSTVGAFTELARFDDDATRSHDANFSVVAVGKNASFFTQDPDEHSFGENSFWKRFLDNDGIFLTFNLENTFITFRHYLEKIFNVKYRYDKAFKGKIINGDSVEDKVFYHYVRDLGNPEYIPDRKKFHKLALQKNLLKKETLGKGYINLITAKDAYEVGKEGIEKDPAFFIKAKKVNDERKPNLNRYFDRLFPICRSLTGNGNRKTLEILSEIIDLKILEVPSGTQCFDWTIPPEWNVKEAWIKNSKGEKIVDFKKNNLHLLNYSISVHEKMDLKELKKHLHSLPDKPDLIPYLTSYYSKRWGFCITHNQYNSLQDDLYEVFIESTHDKNGSMTIAEAILKGKSDKEVLLSTYICHPSMANNELSGPLVTSFFYKELKKLPNRYYTYRFLFIPETIGSIYYLSQHGEHLKKNLVAGYVVSCIGDTGKFTYKKSRQGDSLADRCAESILKQTEQEFIIEDFFPTGSDERQFCSPGFNLPVGSLMRTRYGKYPEYHTSGDNKDLISFEAMEHSITKYLEIVNLIENNFKYINTMPFCEPQLGKRGLYPTLGSQKNISEFVNSMMWILNLSDGNHDLIHISQKSNIPVAQLIPVIKKLIENGILTK